MKRFEETCKIFEISRPTLYAWIKKGCPCHVVGEIRYFDIKEVENWIKSDNKKE